MAGISLGKITWDLQINSAGATEALKTLQEQVGNLGAQLRQSPELFGGLSKGLTRADRDVNKTTRELGALARNLNKVGGGGSGGGGGRGGGAGRAAAGMRNFGKSSKETETKVVGLNKALAVTAATIGSLVTALGGMKLARFAKDATFLAARVQNFGTVVQNVGRIAGFNAEQINNLEKSIKGLGITTRAARQGLAQLAQANIDLSKAATLTRIAQDAAVIAGIDSSEAFNRLVVSIQRNDVRLLRNLGIVINLNSVYRKFSQQTGRTVAQLTAFEKRQIVMNEVIERGALITGTYEKSLRDVFKQITSLRRKIEEATLVFGKQFIPHLEAAVDIVNEFFENFEKGTALFTPRTLALITAGGVALAGIATAMGGITVAAAALTVSVAALNPMVAASIAAFTILSGVLATTALVYLNSSLAAAEQREALERSRKEAKDTAQAMVDLQPAIMSITETMNAGAFAAGTNEERYRKLRATTLELAAAFPDLADELQDAANSTDNARLAATRLRQVLKKKPGSLLGDEERLDTQVKLVEDLNEELEGTLNFLISQKKVRAAIAESSRRQQNIDARNRKGAQFGAELTADLERQTAEEQIRLKAELASIGATSAAEAARLSKTNLANISKEIKLQELLTEKVSTHIDTQRTVLDVFKDIDAAAAAAAQTRIALDQKAVRSFKDAIQQISEARNRASQEEGRLAAQSLARIRGTDAAKIAQAQETQKRLLAIRIKEADELERASEKSTRVEIENERRKLLEDQEKFRKDFVAKNLTFIAATASAFDPKPLADKLREGLEDIKRASETEQRNIAARAGKTLEEALEGLNATDEQRAQVLKNVIEINDDRVRSILATKKAAEELRAGALPEIVNLRQREAKETASLVRQGAKLVELRETQLELLRETSDGKAAGEILRFLAEINRGIALVDEKTLALTAKFAGNRAKIQKAAAERERRRVEAENKRRLSELDRILREEEKLFRRRIEIGEDGEKRLALLTKKGVDARIDALERASGKVEDFIARQFNVIANETTKGLGDITSTLNDFEKAINDATTSAQLADLESLFPKVIAKNIADANKELEEAKKKLNEFDDDRRERDSKARSEVQKRTKELTAAGVRGRIFQEEIQRLQNKQQKEQRAERAKLATEVEKQQTRQKALQDAASSGEDEISKAIQERSKMLRPESQQLGELVTLKEESVRLAHEENKAILVSIELLKRKKEALLGTFPDTPLGQEEKAKAEAKVQEEAQGRAQDKARLERLAGKDGAPQPAIPGTLPGRQAASDALARARAGLPPLQPGGPTPLPPTSPTAQAGPLPGNNAAEAALRDRLSIEMENAALKKKQNLKFVKDLIALNGEDTEVEQEFNKVLKKMLEGSKKGRRALDRKMRK